MRDRRAPWEADLDFVSRDNLNGMVRLHLVLTARRRSTYGSAPQSSVGRRVIVELSPSECERLERQLARYSREVP